MGPTTDWHASSARARLIFSAMWSVRLSTYSRRTVARGVNARVFVCACADHLSARPPARAPIRPLLPLRYSRLS